MMKNRTLPVALFALAALSACGSKSEETVNDTIADPMETELANAPKVELPPPLKSSKAYRCKDNSLVYIDLFEGGKLANVRVEKTSPPVQLKAAEAGQPLEAEGGYKIEGTDSPLTVTLPGKGAQSCKA